MAWGLDRAQESKVTGAAAVPAHPVDEVKKAILEAFVPLWRAMVDYPKAVEVFFSADPGHGRTILVSLKVKKEDLGMVIGRQGRTADALRTLLNCVTGKLGYRGVLEVIE